MARIVMLKHGETIQLVWGIDATETEAPTQGGRQVAPWEEIDGKLASDYDNGTHYVDAENANPPKAMESTLFLKGDGRFAVLWDEQVGEQVVDHARHVSPDELIDGTRAADYADGTHVVARSNRKEER